MGCPKLDILEQDYTSFGLAEITAGSSLCSRESGCKTRKMYRYGFQGQEADHETGYVNYTYRMHDPNTGRFFAVDPLTSKYPFYSPYSFSGNRVIDAVELEGLEPWELNKTESTTTYEGNGDFSSSTSTFSGTVYGPYANDNAAMSGAESGTATIFNYSFSSEKSSTRGRRTSTESGSGSSSEWQMGKSFMLPNREGGTYNTSSTSSFDMPASGACYSTDVLSTLIDLTITQPLAGGLEYLGMSETAAQYTATGATFAGALYLGTTNFGTRGATKGSLSETKEALILAKKKIGLADDEILPKINNGKFGSPQRGTPKRGYRLDPAHPNAKLGSGEEFPHINYWDYSNGKRGSGGVSGAIPIKK